ncbi:metallophosphoesterase family protein [Allostreptomyces psammosilenae]|uniref:Putative MPP superfamily phosphohydrolase n=1 Tax=Allostreptomyces psammosilenae TaxID=1892865 RepID=A0A852ZWR0_9ACTN|nr:metallophosphoesterase [Allostreptomyces psammosilenae]NYI05184.1 putative MPP superfamily phosphohydrolase [Allostreptomyces psammosilenae]
MEHHARPGGGATAVPRGRVGRALRRVRQALGAPAPRRAALVVLAAAIGGWLGMLLLGGTDARVGPVDTSMSLRPAWSGGTTVDIPPLGSLELATHYGPLRLDVDVTRLDVAAAQAIVERPEQLTGLQERITADVSAAVRELVVRSVLAALLGAAVAGWLVTRRPRRALLSGGVCLGMLVAGAGTAVASWNPTSVLEPKFTGLLASAPSVVGSARSIVTEFDVYGEELAKLVTNVTTLYETASTLPTFSPDPGTVRVLHVSDIHLNPAAWDVIRSLTEQYQADVIIDSGDLMDHGTSAENAFAGEIETLGAPYVWVRGNHDSLVTQRAVEQQENAIVLDRGATTEIAGLTIAGWGDPVFTPDRTTDQGSVEELERQAGQEFAQTLREREEADPDSRPDIAVAHEPTMARELDGLADLVLSGHTHTRSTEVLPGGTRLMVQGSTGGAGLRALEGEEPTPVQLSVLYLDRDTGELQAWDDIELGGLGQTTAEISRHLASEPPVPPEEGVSPSPSPTSPTPTAPTPTAPATPTVPSPAAPRTSTPTPLGPSPAPTPEGG